VAQQDQQQLVLPDGQLDRPASPRHLPAARIKHQIAVDQRVVARLAAPQHRADARQQLVEVERLGHVVVGTKVERAHLVDDLVAGGEHDDRHLAVQPQAAADLEAVRPRHGDVEQHHVGPVVARGRQRRVAVGNRAHLEALVGQTPLEQPDDLRIVVDQQQPSCHTPQLPRPWRPRSSAPQG
jgi:hypothetical protein